jgi:hypothetical protein
MWRGLADVRQLLLQDGNKPGHVRHPVGRPVLLRPDVWSQPDGSGFERGSNFPRKLFEINPSELKIRKKD